MHIPVFGSVYNSIKMLNLEMKWQERKKNPFLPKNKEENSQIANIKQEMERIQQENKRAAIDGKMAVGGKLTYDEMEYLRAHHPDLYEKAVEIDKEREAFKKSLENCRTKDEVDDIHAYKMQSFLLEVHTIKRNSNIPAGKKAEQLLQVAARMMAVQGELLSFKKTKRYNDLPTKEEIELKKKKRKKSNTLLDVKDRRQLVSFDKAWRELQRELYRLQGKMTGATVENKQNKSKGDLSVPVDQNPEEQVQTYTAKRQVKKVSARKGVLSKRA